ncbi:hypothetical protein BH24BAC1_BH24BAC1_26770 [soil metagenome]
MPAVNPAFRPWEVALTLKADQMGSYGGKQAAWPFVSPSPGLSQTPSLPYSFSITFLMLSFYYQTWDVK